MFPRNGKGKGGKTTALLGPIGGHWVSGATLQTIAALVLIAIVVTTAFGAMGAGF